MTTDDIPDIPPRPGDAEGTAGDMRRGWWTLETTIEPDDTTLDHIAASIREGFTSGEIVQYPTND